MQHIFPGCCIHSLRRSDAVARLLTVQDCPPPPTLTHSNLIPETSGPDNPANEAFPAALLACLPVCLSAQWSSKPLMPNAAKDQTKTSPPSVVCQHRSNDLVFHHPGKLNVGAVYS